MYQQERAQFDYNIHNKFIYQRQQFLSRVMVGGIQVIHLAQKASVVTLLLNPQAAPFPFTFS